MMVTEMITGMMDDDEACVFLFVRALASEMNL